jgi:tetratricopeptide (TPR) repeat protein
MEVLLGVLIGIAGLLGIALSRFLTTLVHELGHAVSALILTKDKVEMYVGSYGDDARSINLKIGRLSIFLSFIIWNMEIGLCRRSSDITILRAFIITLSGPLLSLGMGVFFLYAISLEQFSDTQKFLLAVLMVSAIWDFFVNIIPRSQPIQLANGVSVNNDGKQLVDLFKRASSPKEFLNAIALFEAGDYSEALKQIEQLLKTDRKSRDFQETKLDILRAKGDDDEYLMAYEEYIESRNPKVKYISHWAKVKIKKHDYDEVVSTLTKLIYEGKSNYDFHFLRGKALVELSEYKDALRDFHALTLGDAEDPRALANRAYCQFRLGYEDEAIEDVLQAVKEGKKDMGEIYFLAGVIIESKDEEKALEFYRKALDLDYDHHALAFNISRIEKYK